MTNKLRHYFIPHETNNYKAKTLHHSFLIFYLIVLLIVQTFTGLIRSYQNNILGFASNITVEKILELINQERIKANITPLTISSQLSNAANEKASDMFVKDYWAHISPTGVAPWYFITKTGYNYVYAGENLAKSFNTSAEVVSAWMKSPTHRANILKPEYQDIGLAVVNGRLNGEETTLVVQEFGTKSTIEAESKSSPPIQNQILPETQVANFTPFTRLSITKTTSLLVTEFLLVILFIDSLFIFRNKTIRISGHSLAHIMFFLALLGALGATGIGVIL